MYPDVLLAMFPVAHPFSTPAPDMPKRDRRCLLKSREKRLVDPMGVDRWERPRCRLEHQHEVSEWGRLRGRIAADSAAHVRDESLRNELHSAGAAGVRHGSEDTRVAKASRLGVSRLELHHYVSAASEAGDGCSVVPIGGNRA